MSRFRYRTRTVEVDGETFHVRSLSSRQFRATREAMAGKPDEEAGLEMLARAVLYGLCNEDGTRALTDDDYEEVLDMPISMQRVIGEAVIDISGLGNDLGN